MPTTTGFRAAVSGVAFERKFFPAKRSNSASRPLFRSSPAAGALGTGGFEVHPDGQALHPRWRDSARAAAPGGFLVRSVAESRADGN